MCEGASGESLKLCQNKEARSPGGTSLVEPATAKESVWHYKSSLGG